MTGAQLIAHIIKELDKNDIRLYDSHILNSLRKMSAAELLKLLNRR